MRRKFKDILVLQRISVVGKWNPHEECSKSVKASALDERVLVKVYVFAAYDEDCVPISDRVVSQDTKTFKNNPLEKHGAKI